MQELRTLGFNRDGIARLADLLLRVGLLVGAYYHFLGYTWAGSKSESVVYQVYLAMPLAAFTVAAFVPNALFARLTVKLLAVFLTLFAGIRCADQLFENLTLVNGPHYRGAAVWFLSIVLLFAVLAKTYYLTARSRM